MARDELQGAISKDLGMPLSWVEKAVLKAPYTYKIYYIDKRNGGKREIAQPARETKLLQYWVIDNVLHEFPVSKFAVAYRKKISLKVNAEKHKGSKYLAKFDFRSFFPSIKGEDLRPLLEEQFADVWGSRDLRDVIRICFRKKRGAGNFYLSIGAPSSPFISNVVMYKFDNLLAERLHEKGIVYTRYADDITLSANKEGVLFEAPEILKKVMNENRSPRLELNESKTVFTSKKYQRRVTGLVLTNDGKVSIGRQRKRMISAMVHRFKSGRLDGDEAMVLKGWLAYSMDVEPDFVARLINKYGEGALYEVLPAIRRIKS